MCLKAYSSPSENQRACRQVAATVARARATGARRAKRVRAPHHAIPRVRGLRRCLRRRRSADDIVGATDMALWHVLILICVVLPIGTSLSSAGYANVGLGGYALAIAVGLAVGAGCGWTMWTTHKTVVRKLQSLLPSQGSSLATQDWYFRAFYVAKIVWVGFAGILGFWLSSALLPVIS